jgi:two-component system autoinducer 2 sensor kinase/phosphatase LuxQ
LISVKEIAIDTEIMIESLYDPTRINEPGYLDEFELEVAPIIKELALLGEVTKSSYIFLEPTLDGNTHDVWYTDLNDDGPVSRQEEFSMSFYDNLGPGDLWYIVPRDTRKPYWTEPYQGSVEQDQHIIYVSHTRPVIVNDEFIGVVGSDYHFSKMRQTIQDFKLYETGYGILLDKTGSVIVHPTEAVGTNLKDSYGGEFKFITDAIINQESGIVEYKWADGEDKFMVFNTIENGWKFAIAIERDEVFLWIKKLQLTLFLMVLIIFVIMSFIGYQLSNAITKPVQLLVRTVEKIGSDNYDTVVPIKLLKRNDETGMLAQNIESMRLSQKESFKELNAYSSVLEEKVESRSLLLLESHKRLEETLILNESQSEKLHSLNNKLASVFEKMEKTQRKLIETEKVASMNAIMTRVAYEFYMPLESFKNSIEEMMIQKNSIETGISKGCLTENELYHFLNTFELHYTNMMLNLESMKKLVERFKALNPLKGSLMTNFNICELVHVVIDGIDLHLGLTIDVLCNEEIVINNDAAKMSQMFYHLLINAVDHGFKEIESGMIVVDINQIDDKLIISIKDNGCGLESNRLNQLFQPIYKNDANSGYGLNIVYNIVHKIFHGEIECKSELNFGTEFTITIGI